MNKLVATTLSGALVLFGLSVPAAAQKRSPDQMFSKMDSNGDGKLSMEEFQGRKSKNVDAKKKRFGKLDSNGDGSLSKEEFAAGMTSGKKKK